MAKLVENRLLNGEGSAKETRHFVIDVGGSGLSYTCGDSLGVFPTNESGAVEAVLGRLGAAGDEPVRLPRDGADLPLREALQHRLSLAKPSGKLLGALLGATPERGERAALEELLAPGGLAAQQAFLAEREVIDLLEEFPAAAAHVGRQEVAANLRKLNPRLYSIASSPVLYPGEVHLTVAVVRYTTNERERIGVCSTFLAERVEADLPAVPVFVAPSHFGLPADGATDCIMVGPGTGVAPFRAFLQEREARGATGRNWLFFGDQHAATDFLYGDEFEAAVARGALHRLDLAWSRDQGHKVYVQHRMLERAAEFWAWVEGGAHIYVCGDARRMAKDVDAALHQIAREQGGLSEEGARSAVRDLKDARRYQRDVY